MQTDVLIIGAGPAGTVAASMILKAGLNILIIEKEKFPRFVIGESLLPRCMDAFEAAGFLPAIEKTNFQKKYGATFIRGEEECIFDFSEQFTKGYSWTWQVPRDEFDKVLADEVERQGAVIKYQTEVIDIAFNDNSQTTTIKNTNGSNEEIQSKFVIDASGYGRVIPNILDLDAPSTLGSRSSLFTQVIDSNRPTDNSGNRITIVDHGQGIWIWIIPFSNGKTSLGFVAPPEFIEKYDGNFRNMISQIPEIAERFDAVEYAFEPVLIPSYSIGVKQLHGNGWVLTGNATEFLDPVFSSGVTFAVESGMEAGKLAAKQIKGENVDWAVSYDAHIAHGVETFRTFVNSWYNEDLQTIFFAPDGNEEIKKKICSVLAGYVWDKKNPYVRNHRAAVGTLASLIREKMV